MEDSLPRLPQGRVVEAGGTLPRLPQAGLVDSLERFLDHLDTTEVAASFCCGVRIRGCNEFIKRLPKIQALIVIEMRVEKSKYKYF